MDYFILITTFLEFNLIWYTYYYLLLRVVVLECIEH